MQAFDGFVRLGLVQRAPPGAGRGDERRLAPAGEDAVVCVQRPVHLRLGGALERLDEALAEVVAEEGVQQRVQHAVGVAHDRDHLVQLYAPARHDAVVGEREHDLEDPIWQPADDVDNDDGENHLGDAPVRASLLLGAARRAGRL